MPATVFVDTVGASATVNGAIIQQAAATTVPGDFNTFLRLDDNGTQHGYNTDGRPHQFDQLGGLSVTHSLKLVDIPTVNIAGTDYREFYLHISESSSSPRLSMEELRFFTAEVGNLRNYNTSTDRLSNRTAVYNLDSAGNQTVVFRDRLNGTTGKGDAFVYIPSSVFGNATYVYLYSRFGGRNEASGNPEEWGVRPVQPPPTGGSLSGFVYVTMDGDEFREPNNDPPETFGPSGVEITLLLDGQVVATTTTTGPNGFYTFTNLAAGTYTISRGDDPPGFFDSLNQVGSLGGSSVERGFEDPSAPDLLIVDLTAGATGIDYNFGLFEAGPPS